MLALTIGADGRGPRRRASSSRAGARSTRRPTQAAKRLRVRAGGGERAPRGDQDQIHVRVHAGPAAPASRAVPAPPARVRARPRPRARPGSSEDVVVHGARRRHDETDVTIAAAQASKVVGTQGDPIKVLENLPGLARPSFGSGQLIVWGSSPNETRTYVDGVEIPALFHGSALRSTVNGDLVRDVTLTPGAYGADYGLAIGGMVRVETKDLAESGVHGYAGADTLDGSAMLTAALGDRVRVGVAGRYGWLNSLLQAVDAPNVDQFFAIPRYSDYQGKLQARLREGESLDAVFLGSTDSLSQVIPDADPARVRSETTSAAYQRFYLRYRRELEDGATVDVTPWIGHDTSNLTASFGENPATQDESTWRWGLRASHRSRVAAADRARSRASTSTDRARTSSATGRSSSPRARGTSPSSASPRGTRRTPTPGAPGWSMSRRT